MFKLESELVNAFVSLHKQPNKLIKECSFRWGKIDVVQYDFDCINHLNITQYKYLLNKKNLIIFSTLYRNKGLKFETIVKKSKLPSSEVEDLLKGLEMLDLIRIDSNLYYIDQYIDFPDVKLTAYEMKLTNIRKALNQAIINLDFCDYSYVVMPSEKLSLCQKYIENFSQSGIGLIIQDNKSTKTILTAKKILSNSPTILKSKLVLIHSLI